jgi:type I restriction enzyme R subunit
MTPESEAQTRRKRIDPLLKQLGWEIVPFSSDLNSAMLQRHAVTEHPTASGPSDYVLFVKGKPLGALEAKKLEVGSEGVLVQAQRYSRDIVDGAGNWNGYRIPFLYSSNGLQHWFADVRREDYMSRQLMGGLHSPEALADMFSADPTAALGWFKDHPVEETTRLRPYQRQAITAVEAALAKHRRDLMLAMATGTGKTFTVAALLYRLLASGFAKRILFLVDRKALAAQAVRELASFDTPNNRKFNAEYEVYSQRFRREDFGDEDTFDPKILPETYLTKPDGAQTFVYVSTIQRMAMNLFGKGFGAGDDAEDEDDANTLDIPIHAFDLIVADECHRGYTLQDEQVWRETLNHFDAVKLGLTATPAKHTTAIFGNPVFTYGMQQAIDEGYLVDFDQVNVDSQVRLLGVPVKEADKIVYVDRETGEQIVDEAAASRQFGAADTERSITAPDSNRKIVDEVAKYALAHEQEHGRFPKILFFAVNDLPHVSHADQLVRACREVFGRGDEFVQKITGSKTVDRPLQRIREFRNRPKPMVAVTVDLLSTGVDIPDLEFIVFLRPVQSPILWTQMIGRGTRRSPNFKKDRFLVFDCFNGTLVDRFKDLKDFGEMKTKARTLSNKELIETIWTAKGWQQDEAVRKLSQRLKGIDEKMSGKAREDFSAFVENGNLKAFATVLPQKLKSDFLGTMEILRKSDFQELLEDYERAKEDFLIAPMAEDNVASEMRFRRGQDYLPAGDYLMAFSAWVEGNKDTIEAMRILLQQPQDWSPKALKELKEALRGGLFEVLHLQKAHAFVHHKELADILSMVKHAVREEEPLLTAAERVDKAMAVLMAGKTFTEEQKAWLGYLREHLATNLSLDPEDFDLVPTLENHGGLSRARKVFGEDLETVLVGLNAAIAA